MFKISTQIIFISLFFANLANAKTIQIVATIPYIADLVKNITCHNPNYNVISLAPAGVDTHTYILTPNDRILLKNANIIIQVGAGLEHWLDKIPFEKGQNRLILSQPHVFDPHIWQSPVLTEQIVNTLFQFLITQNIQDKNVLKICTQKYIEKIHITVAELNKQVEIIPKQNRIIVTNHNSLGYFAAAFGFKVYSLLGLSDEDEPSAEQIKNLILMLRSQHIKSIFLESTGTSKNIQTIAENAHVQIGGKLYGDSFGEKGSGADTTIGIWTTNMTTLVKALQ